MKALNWGIIGCGDVTEKKSGHAFNLARNSRLRAVMRRDGAKAEDYARRHGVPRWYDDAGELIADPEINAVYIATPPSSHAEYAVRCLESGKDVYLEKPLARNMEEAARIAGALAASEGKLSIAHYRRAQPMFRKIRDLLERQSIGAVRLVMLRMLQPAGSDIIASVEDNWRVDLAVSGGGLFHDLAPHQLDLMVYFFGNARNAHGCSRNQAGLYPADDLVTGEILFESGVVMQGAWCFSVAEDEKTDRCEIIGERGKIAFPVFGSEATLLEDRKRYQMEFPPLEHVQQPMIEEVCAYFQELGPNPCSLEEAMKSLEIMEVFTRKPSGDDPLTRA